MFRLFYYWEYILKYYIGIITYKKYNTILEKIGDYMILDSDDMQYLKTLPKEKLMNIIELYNENYTETIIYLVEEKPIK